MFTDLGQRTSIKRQRSVSLASCNGRANVPEVVREHPTPVHAFDLNSAALRDLAEAGA